MNVIYFASGDALKDGEIRRQCLRIPEVLTVVQLAQKEHDLDLMSCLSLDEEYRKLNEFQAREFRDLVQQGLFERFCRLRVPYADTIRRSQYRSVAGAVKEFKWMLRTGEPTTIYVIGPGMDEVPRLVSAPNASWIDVIDNDPQLAWFWGELKKAANA